ncbi:MAG: hypothetical protein AB1451_13585 [Nitrospirota bacterium]
MRKIVARPIHRRSVSVLFALIFALATAPGCSRSSSDTVPDALLGVWTTPDHRYSGRFLEFRPHFVTFGLGEEGQAVYPVSSVEWTSESGQSSFTVYYEGEDGSEYSVTLYRAPFDETLVFKNQLQTHWFRKRT